MNPIYAIHIERPAALGIIDIRGDEAVRRLFSAALGSELPTVANTAIANEGVQTLWLGPDHWLVLCSATEQVGFEKRLSEAVAEQFAAVTVVSDHYSHFQISGPNVHEVLCQGISLDLHPRKFQPGHCARSKIARTEGIILRSSATPELWDLFVEASYAQYLSLWLRTAAGQTGA